MTVLLVYLAVSLAVGIAVAVWAVRTLLEPTHELTSKALDILMQARVLVEEDARGSHHAVKVELPIEAVNELAETALEAQDSLGGRRAPTD